MPADAFAGVADRTLHWTVSVHIDNDCLREAVPRLFDRLRGPQPASIAADRFGGLAARRTTHQTEIQTALSAFYARRAEPGPPRTPISIALRNAMEPMFDDVADRERLGVVEDYLLAIPAHRGDLSPTASRKLTIRMAEQVEWSTEGRTYRAKFQSPLVVGEPGGPSVELRRFWYVHRNFSLSYHLAFSFVGYEHGPQTFYLFSTLQKQVAPKEFALPEGIAEARVGDAPVPLAPFTALGFRDDTAVPITDDAEDGRLDFWSYAAQLFHEDFADLHDGLCGDTGPAFSQFVQPPVDAWRHIVQQEPFVGVPGLWMPHCRQMFYFADEVFRDLLLPKRTDGAPARRFAMIDEAFFDQTLVDYLEALADAAGDGPVDFDLWTWDWIADRRTACIAADWLADHSDDPIAPARAGRDAGAGKDTNLLLCLLFLAGFNQNIVDFLNQDSSEVLDSLDPIYPTADEDLQESFFARYANPQSLITYVRTMRSLDTGNDYIGTCPYAFLIHVLTLHNEFLARDFEYRANATIRAVDGLAAREQWRAATERFYRFRENEQREYESHHYRNVFRYDTESKIFDELERIRGIQLTHAYSNQIISSAEDTIGDAEARRSQDDERVLNGLVGFIGVFSVLQVIFQMSDVIKSGGIDDLWHWLSTLGSGARTATSPLAALDQTMRMSWLALGLLLSHAGIVFLVVALVVILRRRRRRRR